MLLGKTKLVFLSTHPGKFWMGVFRLQLTRHLDEKSHSNSSRETRSFVICRWTAAVTNIFVFWQLPSLEKTWSVESLNLRNCSRFGPLLALLAISA